MTTPDSPTKRRLASLTWEGKDLIPPTPEVEQPATQLSLWMHAPPEDAERQGAPPRRSPDGNSWVSV